MEAAASKGTIAGMFYLTIIVGVFREVKIKRQNSSKYLFHMCSEQKKKKISPSRNLPAMKALKC